jgi:hypothetical protein
VRRWLRWAARAFRVRAPRAHLLPAAGQALLELTMHNWMQVTPNVFVYTILDEDIFFSSRSSMTLRSVRFGVRSRKLSNVGQSLDG